MSVTPPSPTTTVRLATSDDLDALTARESAAIKGSAAESLALQEAGDYFFVLGLLDGTVGGRLVLDCRPDNDLLPETKLLWVYPEARRRGLAAAMTAFAEQRALDLGYDEMFLGVNPDNPAAIPLYIGLEYTPTGDHREALNTSVEDAGARSATEAIYRKSLTLLRR